MPPGLKTKPYKNRDVSTGTTGATAIAPNFSDTLTFCKGIPSQMSTQGG